jgi:hypothetical protein
MKTGICKLCLKEKPLVKKSHIIPKFMYGGMHDENRSMTAQSLKEKVVRSGKPVQQGIFDKYVLCQSCENDILGSLDRYGANILFQGNGMSATHGIEKDGIKPLFVSGIDYDKFKTFLISILWRAHISANPFFENIDLGVEAEVLRQIVLNTSHVDEGIYKVCIFALKYSPTELHRIVITPMRVTALGADFYAFIINGLAYFINMQRSDEPSFFTKGFLRNGGSVEVHQLDAKLSQWFLRSYFKVGQEGVRQE